MLENEYHYYYYNSLFDGDFLTNRWRAIQINPRKLSEINFGIFTNEGVFKITGMNGICAPNCFFYGFQCAYVDEAHFNGQKQEFHIKYSIGNTTGILRFYRHQFNEHAIIKLLSRLIPFINQNHKQIFEKGFRNEPFDNRILEFTLENHLLLLDSVTAQLRETSEYVPRRDNKFFDDIILSIPNNANRYFRKVLYDFCENILGGVRHENESENLLIYRCGEDSAWIASYDEKISTYDWHKEKAQFIVYLASVYDYNECLKILLLNE